MNTTINATASFNYASSTKKAYNYMVTLSKGGTFILENDFVTTKHLGDYVFTQQLKGWTVESITRISKQEMETLIDLNNNNTREAIDAYQAELDDLALTEYLAEEFAADEAWTAYIAECYEGCPEYIEDTEWEITFVTEDGEIDSLICTSEWLEATIKDIKAEGGKVIEGNRI